MVNQTNPPKILTRVEVFGLLNYFNHAIDFPADQEFICLHGPNGVGKTRLLELVKAALSGEEEALRQTPFLRLELEFSDGSRLRVEQREIDGELYVRWSVGDHANSLIEVPPTDPAVARQAARWLYNEGLIRRRPGPSGIRFFDNETDEELTEEEAARRYAAHLPEELVLLPSELTRFVEATSTRLIEVGRLREIPIPFMGDIPQARRETRRISAVSKIARDLADRIRSVRVQYSVAAQRVDRTYANRLIRASTQAAATDAEIREQYARVLDRQDELATLSLLEAQQGVFALPEGELADWQRRAVGLHLSDSLRKLATFDRIAERLTLFKEIVNGKLQHKSMSFDAAAGYRFVSDLGGSATPIGPDQLSSGEQHLVVMTYRLLFEAEEGELVLIDEPEISLHVAWQKQFLDDLQKIAELQHLRFVVATHSPQIVGRWVKRLISLGSVE